MITFGKPAVLEYNKESNQCLVHIDDCGADFNILSNLYEHIKHISSAHVCLSGGVDSQFWVRVCEHFSIPYRVSTYLTFWEGSPVNTDDYVHAELLHKQYGFDWNVVHIDLKDFLDNHLLSTAKKYKTASQQLALHTYFLEKIVNPSETFMLGGDSAYMIKGLPNNMLISSGERVNDLYTYKTFFEQHNAEYVKDVFYLDPKMLHAMLKLNIDLVKTTGYHLETSSISTLQHDTLSVKSKILDAILPGSINTMMKVTGFERVKKYLASTSGIYNQFDILYRAPLEEMLRLELPVDVFKKPTLRITNKELVEECSQEFLFAIDKHNSKPLEHFIFDF